MLGHSVPTIDSADELFAGGLRTPFHEQDRSLSHCRSHRHIHHAGRKSYGWSENDSCRKKRDHLRLRKREGSAA